MRLASVMRGSNLELGLTPIGSHVHSDELLVPRPQFRPVAVAVPAVFAPACPAFSRLPVPLFLVFPPPLPYLMLPSRGCSSDGRALHSHCRGQGFDPPQLHGPYRLAGTGIVFALVGLAQAPAVLPSNRPSGQPWEGRAGAISLDPVHYRCVVHGLEIVWRPTGEPRSVHPMHEYRPDGSGFGVSREIVEAGDKR